MAKFIARIFLTTCFVGASLPASADGLIYNGHVAGLHTRVTLSTEQIRDLDRGGHEITLTDRQRSALPKVPGADQVSKLHVLPKTAQTCTCELANAAVRVEHGSIEVADQLFARDFDQTDIVTFGNRYQERANGLKVNLQATKPSRAAALTSSGLEQQKKNRPKTAISYYKMALAAAPNYKWAKRSLAESYCYLGSDSMLTQKNYKGAIVYFDLALETVDHGDKMLVDSIKRNLAIATAHVQDKK